MSEPNSDFDPMVTTDDITLVLGSDGQASYVKTTSVLSLPIRSPQPKRGPELRVQLNDARDSATVFNLGDEPAKLDWCGEGEGVAESLDPMHGVFVPVRALELYAYNGKPLTKLLADHPTTTDASTTP